MVRDTIMCRYLMLYYRLMCLSMLEPHGVVGFLQYAWHWLQIELSYGYSV